MKLTKNQQARLASWKPRDRFSTGEPALPKVCLAVVSELLASCRRKTARGKLAAVIEAARLVLAFLESLR